MNPNNMGKLKRYNLDFELTLEFFTENLRDVSALSCEFLNVVDFRSGNFFTLLPENTTMSKIHDFEDGGILPQNAPKKYPTGQKTFTLIPSIKEELSKLISQQISSNENKICVFDDVSRTATDPGLEDYRTSRSLLTVKDEVCYVLKKENNSSSLAKQLQLQSFTFWHTFALISNAGAVLHGKDIQSLEMLRPICEAAQIAFVGAYDGEGYVFWGTKNGEGFDLK